MRKINTGDVFKMARLIKHGNISQTVKKAFEAGKQKDADAEQIGMDVAVDILCSCTGVDMEKEFYGLLSGICEKKPEDIEKQSLEATIEDIRRIFEENNILNFLNSASNLSGKIQG